MEGLKVIVTHRITIQKFKIAGLTDENTRDISFDVDQISDRKIYVPMEFCCIDKGQRFAKEHLNKYQSDKLRNISLATSKCRESTSYDKVAANCEQVWIATSKVKHGQNPSIASPCV